jgi:prevent-host-death family protein
MVSEQCYAMNTIPLADAQAQLPALVRRLMPGDEVVITEDNEPVARILPAVGISTERRLGTMQGTVLYIAPDFDAPLGEFQEYGA